MEILMNKFRHKYCLLNIAQWASDVLWTSIGRLYEVRTSFRRPLDIQRTSDAYWK